MNAGNVGTGDDGNQGLPVDLVGCEWDVVARRGQSRCGLHQLKERRE